MDYIQKHKGVRISKSLDIFFIRARGVYVFICCQCKGAYYLDDMRDYLWCGNCV